MSWKKLRPWKHQVNRFALNPAKGTVVAARKHPKLAPYIGKAAGLFTLGIGEKVAQKGYQSDIKKGKTSLTGYQSFSALASAASATSIPGTISMELKSIVRPTSGGVPLAAHNAAAGSFWERAVRYMQLRRRGNVNFRRGRRSRRMGSYSISSLQRAARRRWLNNGYN